ncbi:hypothetical protein JGU66_29215 [Myxococcaceae bacterium JPH2]|nr:hypothetical protein [Myxococcaceae bacterium JPH2]
MAGFCQTHKAFYQGSSCPKCTDGTTSSSDDVPKLPPTVLPKPKPQFTVPVTSPPTQSLLKSSPMLQVQETPPSIVSVSPKPSPLKVKESTSTSQIIPSVSIGTKIATSIALTSEPPPSSVTETNKSSAVPKEQMDAFIDGLIKLSPSMGFPLFTLCDNNSFHTTGYLWGFYAAKALKAQGKLDGPVAVLNFDSHSDAGTKASRFVASDRWGGMLVTAIHGEGVPACYLSTFNHPKGRGNHFVAAGGQGTVPTKPTISEEVLAISNMEEREEALKNIFTAFWKSVEQYFDAPIKYVFFTIDRDVLRNSYTQWGDGAIDGPTALIPYLRAALGSYLMSAQETETATRPAAKLIGFDITGLPETMGRISSRTPSDGFKDPAEVWTNLRKELAQMREYAGTLPTPADAALQNVIFFSGSISYTAKTPFQSLPLDSADHRDYVASLSTHLKGLVLTGSWAYLLCRQRPPIYNHGWKPFSLYRLAHGLAENKKRTEVAGQLGDPTPVGGFSCTASVTDSVLMAPKKTVPVSDMFDKTGDFEPYHPDVV